MNRELRELGRLPGMQEHLLFGLVHVDAQGVAQPFVGHLEREKQQKIHFSEETLASQSDPRNS